MMEPAWFTLINAATSYLHAVVESGIVDTALATGLKEFFQRSYRRKEAEAQLAAAIESALEEFSGKPGFDWLDTFVKTLSNRPRLAARVSAVAIEMQTSDPSQIPSDILTELGIEESQRDELAVFLFRLRSELTQIDGYAQAMKYADRLSTTGALQHIPRQHRVAEGYLGSETEIRSGPAEVVASGTVIAFAGNPIEIDYGPRIERLTLIFAFQDDDTQRRRVDASTPNPNTLQLTLVNFASPLGTGTTKPVPIGALVGRRLYIQYRVYDIGDGDKTVHYTIYRGEEVTDDE